MKEKVKVEQVEGRSGPVRNQFIITTEKGQYFQSYSTIIAFRPFGFAEKIKLDRRGWDYSVTTGRYRNLFLGENKAETERKIKAGIYELADLND